MKKTNKKKLAAFRQTLPETWKMCSNQTLITSPVVNGWFVILQYYHLVAIVRNARTYLQMHAEEEAEVKQRQVLFQNVLSHCRWRGNYSGRQQEGKHFFYTELFTFTDKLSNMIQLRRVHCDHEPEIRTARWNNDFSFQESVTWPKRFRWTLIFQCKYFSVSDFF